MLSRLARTWRGKHWLVCIGRRAWEVSFARREGGRASWQSSAGCGWAASWPLDWP